MEKSNGVSKSMELEEDKDENESYDYNFPVQLYSNLSQGPKSLGHEVGIMNIDHQIHTSWRVDLGVPSDINDSQQRTNTEGVARVIVNDKSAEAEVIDISNDDEQVEIQLEDDPQKPLDIIDLTESYDEVGTSQQLAHVPSVPERFRRTVRLPTIPLLPVKWERRLNPQRWDFGDILKLSCGKYSVDL